MVEELVGKCGAVKEVAVKGEENEKGFDDIFIFISTDAKDEVEKYCENNLPGSVLILEISKIEHLRQRAQLTTVNIYCSCL